VRARYNLGVHTRRRRRSASPRGRERQRVSKPAPAPGAGNRTRADAGRHVNGSAAARLAEAERLFRDFVELTPFRFKPFVRSFDSFDDYERWRRAQTNPWYR
jgi:hypothetical protein